MKQAVMFEGIETPKGGGNQHSPQPDALFAPGLFSGRPNPGRDQQAPHHGPLDPHAAQVLRRRPDQIPRLDAEVHATEETAEEETGRTMIDCALCHHCQRYRGRLWCSLFGCSTSFARDDEKQCGFLGKAFKARSAI